MLKNLLKKENTEIIYNMLGALLLKGMGLILSLFTMPAYIRFFNDDATLGLWFTILSVLNWVLYFDFGIGNGLRNCLSASIAVNDIEKSKKYISSAYVSIGLMCLFVITVFSIFSGSVDWHRVFNIDSTSVSNEALQRAVTIVFSGIIAQMFFRIISSVLYALQRSAVSNSLGLFTSVMQVSALYIMPSTDNDTNLVTMAFINVTAVLAPMLAATFIVFLHKKCKPFAPKLKYFDIHAAKEVLSLGGVFLFAQVAYMVIMNTNEYLITLFVGSKWVVEYQVYYKLYSLIGTLFTLVLTPIWSAVTKALAEKRFSWINSLYKKILLAAALCVCAAFCMIPFTKFAVNLWLGEEAIDISLAYCVAFAALSSMMVLNTVFSTFSNGLGKLKVQIVCFLTGAILKIPMSFFAVKIFGSWIGVVWANVVALALYCIVQPPLLKKYFAPDNE